MARIITTQSRYKRPPKKRKPAPLTGPANTTVKRVHGERRKPNPPPPANDDEKPSPKQPAAIVTARAKRGRFGEAPNMSPEEYQQRGDSADALWRELVRQPQIHEGATGATLALVRVRQATDRRGGPGRTLPCLSVVVPADHLRPLRQGADNQ